MASHREKRNRRAASADRTEVRRRQTMYAVTGITGRVGGEVAQTLLAAGVPVRAVVRDPQKAAPFRALGAEGAVADFNDVEALTKAFTAVEGVFVMIPPFFA